MSKHIPLLRSDLNLKKMYEILQPFFSAYSGVSLAYDIYVYRGNSILVKDRVLQIFKFTSLIQISGNAMVIIDN